MKKCWVNAYFLKNNRLNNRDFNIDQNNRDYDLFHNRAALNDVIVQVFYFEDWSEAYLVQIVFVFVCPSFSQGNHHNFVFAKEEPVKKRSVG